MRAARYSSYGPPDVLYECTTSTPTPGPGEFLVRVHASSVNGIDLIVRAGILRRFTGRKFPRGIGLDFAGEIVGMSSDAVSFKVGDRVWGVMSHGQAGSTAEFVCVQAKYLSQSPANLDLVSAAALPAVGVTAITALRDIGQLKAGDRLLVRGASGGVGSVAVQLGRHIGAHVTALARSANLDFVRDLGADLAFDYATTSPRELGTFDVILCTAGSHAGAYRRLLAPGGRMTVICPDPNRPLTSLLYVLMSFLYGPRRVRLFSAKPRTPMLADLATYVEIGAIRPLVDGIHPLSGIADAHRAVEEGGRKGKQIVLLHNPTAS
ncbi:NAD(P)-dependent alcohol dehydrogenase [Burkholderia sp. PAMC 26561]|uniref:NAD(P)-dependent alcohol dehydrogenase n=1 Tax=Burkholderia sp. PAMC 26561 TaxID=1795043 RepID=UPI00076B0D1E|nr:NAD(P)-dependent alcohol dehydrogenase [Burkholderia sp. PAMC 26561]AME28135.1 dehydrogenase [Burkholderia sp. PAMC 26561]